MDYEDFTIVLPTLNEEESLKELLTYLTNNYKGLSVIVVDDGSTDRTKDVALSFSKEARVSFLDRHAKALPRGLTYSIIDGIEAAKTTFVISMDADMQHSPETVAKIADGLVNGADLVVGTRAEVKNWVLYRKIISRSLIYVGYFALSIGGKESCKDIFSGFFGVKRQLFVSTYEQNKQRFVGDGYKVLFDFLKCNKKGSLKVVEVPYVFSGRMHGLSKAGVKQGLALFRSFIT